MTGRRRRSAPTRIGHQDRASWTTLSSRSSGDLHGTRYPFSAWTSERARQTCPIAHDAAVVWKKRLNTLSTTQAARTARRWLRRRQRFASVLGWEVCGASCDPRWNSNGDLDEAKEGLYDDAKFSHRDLVFYFRHQLRVKIRCNRTRLGRITFNKWRVDAATLVLRKGATLGSSFPPLPAYGVYGMGPSGPHPW